MDRDDDGGKRVVLRDHSGRDHVFRRFKEGTTALEHRFVDSLDLTLFLLVHEEVAEAAVGPFAWVKERFTRGVFRALRLGHGVCGLRDMVNRPHLHQLEPQVVERRMPQYRVCATNLLQRPYRQPPDRSEIFTFGEIIPEWMQGLPRAAGEIVGDKQGRLGVLFVGFHKAVQSIGLDFHTRGNPQQQIGLHAGPRLLQLLAQRGAGAGEGDSLRATGRLILWKVQVEYGSVSPLQRKECGDHLLRRCLDAG